MNQNGKTIRWSLGFLALVMTVALGVFSSSCTSDESKREPRPMDAKEVEGKVLHRRSDRSPTILTRTPKERPSFRSSNKTYALGKSYLFQKGFSHENCVGELIFDLEQLIQEHPTALNRIPVKRTYATFYSFASESTLGSTFKESMDDKVKGGLDLKILKLNIKFGSEQSFKSSFKRSLKFDNKNAYGVFHYSYVSDRLTLVDAPALRADIGHNYIDRYALSNLYQTPLAEMFSSKSRYGYYVFMGYETGGLAECLYKKIQKEESTDEELSLSMGKEMEASIKYDGNGGSFAPKAEFSEDWGNELGEKYEDFSICARLYGGNSFALKLNPQSVNSEFSIDFSSWAKSLADENNHVITHILPEGLHPIYEFIPEVNLRNRIKDGKFNKKHITPRIEIEWGYIGTKPLIREPEYKEPKPIYVSLITRYGDNILLSPISDESYSYATTPEEFERKAQRIAYTLEDYYDLDIFSYNRLKNTVSGSLTPGVMGSSSAYSILPSLPTLPIHVSLYSSYINKVDMTGLKESKFKKWYHPKYKNDSGRPLAYLLYDGGASGKRFAYCIYDDYILDAYGIRYLFENASLEQRDISINQYKIIAL